MIKRRLTDSAAQRVQSTMRMALWLLATLGWITLGRGQESVNLTSFLICCQSRIAANYRSVSRNRH